MTDLDSDQTTEVRTTTDSLGRPVTEVSRTATRTNGAVWWAVGLIAVALIAAFTYVITQQPAATNTDAAVAAATQQAQTQAASQAAQTAAAQAQSAAQGAAIVSQAQAQRAASAPPPPVPAPTQSDRAPAQGDQGGSSSNPPPQQ